MRIFLAGPISGRHLPTVYARFAAHAATIRAQGHIVISPTEIHPEAERASPDELMPWEYYMKADIPYLLRCDAIYFMAGRQNSRGCRLEHTIANALGIRILEL